MTQEFDEEEQFFEEEDGDEEYIVDNGCDDLIISSDDDAPPMSYLEPEDPPEVKKEKEITQNLMDRFRPDTPTAKRLIQDAKQIMLSNEDELGFRTHPIGNDLFSWEVQIFKFDEGTPMEEDMKKYQQQTGKDYVQLQVSFPPDYPISPPFVRVIRPRFQFHTGRVTIGGSLCTDVLTLEGWSPAYDIEGLLINIVSAIIDGKPRIDFRNNAPYSVEEAKQAFVRVASDHGWRINKWLPDK